MTNEKFTRKYLRLAKQVGEDSNPCYSRQIGAIIVNPVENRIVGTGYNGPPAGTPHCDEPEYLANMVWPYLTLEDRKKLQVPVSDLTEDAKKKWFLDQYAKCKKCPRRLLGIPSGSRTSLCSCEHAEKNAILNSATSLFGSWMYCWCGICCIDCTKAIINAGIKKLICIYWKQDYSPQSRWLLKQSMVSIEERDEDSLDIVQTSYSC